jgi:uncharacterized protein (UPF0335 family)
MAGIGHNGIAKDQLKSLVDRIERLEEEKKGLATDIKEIYLEAKSNGFDTKVLRKVISMRKLDRHQREEQQAMLDVYMNALGMLVDTPLGQAAMANDSGIRKALSKFGKPVPLSEEEKANGDIAAFESKSGRVSIGASLAK